MINEKALAAVISALINGDLQQGESYSCLPVVGQKVFIRTVTFHYWGRVTRVADRAVVIDKASWIADSGRFHQFLEKGEAPEMEVEVYPANTHVHVMAQSIVDWHVLDHELPRESR